MAHTSRYGAALACIFAGAALTPLDVRGEHVMARQHDEWVSMVVVDAPELRYRTLTETLSDASYVTLAVDHFAGECEARFMSIAVHLPAPVSEGFVSEGLNGQLRVDDHPIRELLYRVGAREDVPQIHMFIMSIADETLFWKEIEAGKVLRFRFGTERRDYYLHFALAGFEAAERRARALCTAHDKEDTRRFFAR